MKKDDLVYLKHILDAIFQIDEYIQGVNYEKFLKKKMIQDAVIRQIEIIGEATKRLSKIIRDKYKEVPWSDMAGMRDKLIHNYLNVDIDAVWGTIEKDIPFLKQKIDELIKSEV